MLNIIQGFQSAIDFIANLLSQGFNAINSFFQFWNEVGEMFSDFGGILPDFMSTFWVIIFGFCVFALIIKLVPFIG